VTVESKPNHVYQNILLEGLPVSDHQLRAADDRLWVTRVHSKNRDTEWLHDVGGVFKAAIILRASCETNLVVGNYMQTTVAGEFREFTES
jgi:hypothetical protein